MIDSHHLEAIVADFVPSHPYNTTQVSIGMGQRYYVMVTAKTLMSGNFWLRVIPQEACSETDAVDNVKVIIRYDSTSTTDSTTFAYGYTDSCADEASLDLVPYLAINASETYTYDASGKVAVGVTGNALLRTMNKTSFRPQWEYPTLRQVAEGNDTWTKKQRVIHLPEAEKWAYMIIHSPFNQRSHDASARSRPFGPRLRL